MRVWKASFSKSFIILTVFKYNDKNDEKMLKSTHHTIRRICYVRYRQNKLHLFTETIFIVLHSTRIRPPAILLNLLIHFIETMWNETETETNPIKWTPQRFSDVPPFDYCALRVLKLSLYKLHPKNSIDSGRLWCKSGTKSKFIFFKAVLYLISRSNVIEKQNSYLIEHIRK